VCGCKLLLKQCDAPRHPGGAGSCDVSTARFKIPDLARSAESALRWRVAAKQHLTSSGDRRTVDEKLHLREHAAHFLV
jgi:hypothetical protein